MFDEFKPIMKFIVPALGAMTYAIQAAVTDNTITVDEWKSIGFSALVALLVYLVPNKQPMKTDDVTSNGGEVK